jgi:hypothetical protein
MTTARINKAIRHLNLEVVGNGDGYFYFVDTVTGYQTGESVMVPYLNRLSLQQWIEEAAQARESNIIEGMREDGDLPHDRGGFAG